MRDHTAQADTPWYKPVDHHPEGSEIHPDAMCTIQIFHPLLLKMLRNTQPEAPQASAAVPVAGRFAGSSTDGLARFYAERP